MAKATQRLYLDAAGVVVLHGDVTATTLLCAAGQEIPKGYAEPVVAEVKQVAKPADKAVKKHEDK